VLWAVARQSTARYGQRRATSSGPMAERRCAGQRLRGERVVPAYCLRPRHPYLATMTKTPRTDRRSEGDLGVRMQCGRVGAPRRRRARRRVCGTCRPDLNSTGPVWLLKTQNFEIEVDQVVNRKVVHLPSLNNFHKGRMGFFSTICAQIACQVH
jgi:hypothetical protein